MPGFGAIGQFALGHGPNVSGSATVVASNWIYQWSDPVRVRPNLGAHRQSYFVTSPYPFVSTGWRANLSEPVRHKRGLRAQYLPFFTLDAQIIPAPSRLMQWFGLLSEPQRQKRGLFSRFQQFFVVPPRVLPTPNVTMVLSATETNNDIALFALNVVGSSVTTGTPRAQVSITEVPIIDGGAVGIAED